MEYADTITRISIRRVHMALSDIAPSAGSKESATRMESFPYRAVNCHAASNRGFTLIELLVVIGILGILSALGMSSFIGFKENARRSRCASEIRTIEKDIEDFALQNIRYPVDLAEIGRGDMLDPWGMPYHYKVYTAGEMRDFAGDLNTDFDLYSDGQDRLSALSIIDPKSLDDIVRAESGGFVGTAKEYGTP